MRREHAAIDIILIGAAIFCFLLASAIAVFIIAAVATGGIFNSDVCEHRIWGHCASLRAAEESASQEGSEPS